MTRRFTVWDHPSREREISAISPEEAAICFAEEDADGRSDGVYTNLRGGPIENLESVGALIYVRTVTGQITRWRVGVTHMEPTFSAIPDGG